jgi:hypothetical protein
MDAIRAAAERAKEASYRLQNLSSELRNAALSDHHSCRSESKRSPSRTSWTSRKPNPLACLRPC